MIFFSVLLLFPCVFLGTLLHGIFFLLISVRELLFFFLLLPFFSSAFKADGENSLFYFHLHSIVPELFSWVDCYYFCIAEFDLFNYYLHTIMLSSDILILCLVLAWLVQSPGCLATANWRQKHFIRQLVVEVLNQNYTHQACLKEAVMVAYPKHTHTHVHLRSSDFTPFRPFDALFLFLTQ